MTKSSNTDSIHKATNKTWRAWVDELDHNGARQMSHAELVKLLKDKLEGVVDSYEWWAQGIAVAYEQHIGKRLPGQLANGLFEIAVSKTVSAPRNGLFPKVSEWFENQTELNGFSILQARRSETSKRSNWRCNFQDGSKFSATVEDNGAKSKLVLSHTAIHSKQDAADWKQYWSETIQTLAAV